MLVPEYWAESRVVDQVGERERVVRRFGWSDGSQDAAQHHAAERAKDAMRRLQQGEEVAARDPKMVYGGAHGLPIREQIVARTDLDVVTRNGYGARCLNVPDVLFADIDDDRQPFVGCLVMLALLGVVIVCVILGALEVPYAVRVGTFALIALFAHAAWSTRKRRGRRDDMLRRVRKQVTAQRDRLAIYETPAGLRVIALHKTFDPAGEDTQELFGRFRTDPVYAKMCLLQACFRARVSGKPWRMGMNDHIRPRPGIWPVREERRAEREAWVTRYEGIADGYAACRFLEEVGDGPIDPRCQRVQRMHDEMCRARTDLPIA